VIVAGGGRCGGESRVGGFELCGHGANDPRMSL
jgi:hypothetical protein